jgi:hypothetical protein
MASDLDPCVADMNVSISSAISPFPNLSPRRSNKRTLAAKSIVRSKTIASGSIVLVIEIARLRGGDGVSVLGRGVRDPLAVEGSRWPILSSVYS